MTAAALRLALGTLTVVPSGDIGEVTRPVAGRAMALAPVASLPLGAGVGAVCAVGDLAGLPPLVTGAIAVGALGLLTRGMHLDGLADTVDGSGAGWDRDRALEVMRRGDVGPMGAAAITVVLLAQAASFGAIAAHGLGWLVAAAAVVVSRSACAAACRRGIPSARPDGMGSLVAQSVSTVGVTLSALVGLAALASTAVLAGASLWLPVAAWLAAAVAVLLLLRHARRVFGGVTGDVIGAAIETALTALVVVLAASTGWSGQ
ncbi:MAG: adenosylcobinamide-GDP ribazoletransferase [Micrococcales bacterium]|nr:adenosylcobinamide-GDP ribazoletransferase [Micrococcales bacterium]